MRYLKFFLIVVFIYPLISWILDIILNREQQIWYYILSGLVVGILFVILLYLLNKTRK